MTGICLSLLRDAELHIVPPPAAAVKTEMRGRDVDGVIPEMPEGYASRNRNGRSIPSKTAIAKVIHQRTYTISPQGPPQPETSVREAICITDVKAMLALERLESSAWSVRSALAVSLGKTMTLAQYMRTNKPSVHRAVIQKIYDIILSP